MNEGSKKILLGEDEAPLSKALANKLTHEGFVVTVASNGEEVLSELEKNSYDLLLLDVMMPKVDGFAVLTKLHEKNSTLPVIVTSNLSQESDMVKAKSLGASEYIVKSNTSLQDIIGHIKKLLEIA